VERILIALLADVHVLLEGVPGLAKTLLVKTVAQAIQAQFARIQFTPDLLPADLVGTQVYNPRTSEFSVHKGPIFANLVLADEINRAPAKVQSALLEVMQERQVTIGGETHKVSEPFLVMATQNPIETEGTYPLPEAQVDRFMMKVLVDYPNERDEFVIVERMTGTMTPVKAVITTEQLLDLRNEVGKVYVDPSLIEYAVRLTTATREPDKFDIKDIAKYIMYGASPRASINLIITARALAFVRGRSYCIPQDVVDMTLDVIRHRLVLSYEAMSDNISSDAILKKILEQIPVPEQPLQTHVTVTTES
jgi:MoxR-like ATPase